MVVTFTGNAISGLHVFTFFCRLLLAVQSAADNNNQWHLLIFARHTNIRCRFNLAFSSILAVVSVQSDKAANTLQNLFAKLHHLLPDFTICIFFSLISSIQFLVFVSFKNFFIAVFQHCTTTFLAICKSFQFGAKNRFVQVL